MDKGQMMRDLPTDIILNIQSFLLGEPHLYKIKHNNALKEIQNKYRINYTKPRIWINDEGGYRGICYEMEAHKLKSRMLDNETNRSNVINYIKDNEVIKTNGHWIELKLSISWEMKTLDSSGEIRVVRFYAEEFPLNKCPSQNILSNTFQDFKYKLEMYERSNFNDQRHFTDIKPVQFQIQVIMKD